MRHRALSLTRAEGCRVSIRPLELARQLVRRTERVGAVFPPGRRPCRRLPAQRLRETVIVNFGVRVT